MFLKKYKTELFIFFIIFAIYSFFTLLKMASHLSVEQLAGDEYFQIANNLIDHSLFSLDGFSPTSLRMPGYPIFLVFIFKMIRNWWAVIFFQNAISALTAVFLYLISKKWLSSIYAIVASFIWAFEPYTIDASQQFLTETMYTFVLVASVWFFLKYKDFIKEKTFILILGLMLAVLTYIRPISFFLPVIYAWALNKKIFSKKSFVQVAGLFFIYATLLFPWALRNHSLFGSWQLSSDNVSSFYITILNFQAQKEGNSIGPADVPAQSEFPKFAESGNLSKTNQELQEGIGLVISNSFTFLDFYLKKLIRGIVITSWWGSIQNLVKGAAGKVNYYKEVSDVLVNFDWEKISNFSLKEIVAAIIMISGGVFWVIILLLSLAGIAYLFKFSIPETRPFLILLVGIIVYLILLANLAAPSAMSRYRLPVSPLIIMFAMVGFSRLIKKFKNNL